MDDKKEIFGGELTDLPNDKYKKFFEKFKEIETLDIINYKPVHILGYFVKKYYETYQVNYKFKFNSPSPSKCFEVFQIKKLAMMLSSDPKILKDYIDWVFFNVVKHKRRLTSISFMTIEKIVNDYKFNVLLSNNKNSNVERSTPLLDKYKTIFSSMGINVNTYGELAFILQIDPMPIETQKAFEQIKLLGFDKDILKKIV